MRRRPSQFPALHELAGVGGERKVGAGNKEVFSLGRTAPTSSRRSLSSSSSSTIVFSWLPVVREILSTDRSGRATRSPAKRFSFEPAMNDVSFKSFIVKAPRKFNAIRPQIHRTTPVAITMDRLDGRRLVRLALFLAFITPSLKK